MSRQFGAVPADTAPSAPNVYACFWLLLDPMLRTVRRMPPSQTAAFLKLVRAATVFSCPLMHEARPVTRGRRYACLPFLYHEADALIAL